MSNITWKKAVPVNISEYKDIFRLFLKRKPSFAFRLDGPPGIGKSEIHKQLAEEFNLNYIDTRLAFKDNVDLIGHLFPNKEKKTSEYLKPEDLPSKEGTIWFFDEVNRVMHPAILNTLFQIISTNVCGVHKLPDKTFIVLAGNLGEEDGTIVTDFEDTALDGRCARFLLDPQYKEWKPWAVKAGVHNSITAFLDKNTEYFARLKGRPWYQANEVLTTDSEFIPALKKGNSVQTKYLEAIIGHEACKEYTIFLKQFDEVDEKMILENFSKHEDELKNTPRERIFSLNTKIIDHIKELEKSKKKLNVKQLSNCFKYALFLDKDTGTRFTTELFSILLILEQYGECMDKEQKGQPTLQMTPEEKESLRQRFA